jgi:hypothetical protein
VSWHRQLARGEGTRYRHTDREAGQGEAVGAAGRKDVSIERSRGAEEPRSRGAEELKNCRRESREM